MLGKLCSGTSYRAVTGSVLMNRQCILNKVSLNSTTVLFSFLGGSDSKASAYNAGDPGSIPGSSDLSIHGIFQARVLEWGAIAFSSQAECLLCVRNRAAHSPARPRGTRGRVADEETEARGREVPS